MKRFVKMGAIIGSLLWPIAIFAQEPDSVDVGVKVSIQAVFDLTIDSVCDYSPTAPGNATPSVDDTVDYFTRMPGQEYTVGSTQYTWAVNLKVQNNVAPVYYLKVRGTGDFQSGSYTFPLSNLKWALDLDPPSQVWITFTTEYYVVASGGMEEQEYYIDYKLNIPWSAPAASNYKTVTRYLLTTQP